MLGDSAGLFNKILHATRLEKRAIHIFLPVKTVAMRGRFG